MLTWLYTVPTTGNRALILHSETKGKKVKKVEFWKAKVNNTNYFTAIQYFPNATWYSIRNLLYSPKEKKNQPELICNPFFFCNVTYFWVKWDIQLEKKVNTWFYRLEINQIVKSGCEKREVISETEQVHFYKRGIINWVNFNFSLTLRPLSDLWQL